MKKCDIRFKVENDLTTIGAVDESNNIQDITAVTEYKNQFDKEARFFYNYKKEVFAFDGYQLKFNESNLKEFNKIQKNENNYYRTRLGDNLVTVRENLEVFVKQGLNSVENFNFKDKENKLFDKGIPFENISIEQRQALSKQNIIYPANIINKTDLPIEIKNYVNLYNQYISLNSSNRANFATNRSVINENTVLYLDSANKLNYIMAASDLASLEESEVHGNNYLSIALAQRGEQEDVNISESVSDNPVYAKRIKELKIELKELVDKRGRVLPGKERQYNNAKNHLAFLEQSVYDQMKSAIILFLQENKIKVNYSLANSLYEIAIKSDTTADFHEKMQDRFYSDIKLPFAFSYFDSWGMSISELMKKEYNRINTESKKFDGKDGIYIERTHSAKDFNNYIKKNGDRQTKYIWKLIKNVAFKINPEIKFVFEENYRDNIYAKAFTQDQTNFKGTRIEIRASLLQNPKQAAATLVHEIIHSIAHNIIDIVVFNKKKQIHLLTERQINAVKELTKLIKEVQANDKTNKFYGATDEHELVSELTNKEFVEALKEKAPNIFRRIQNFFLNILGIEKNKYRRAEAILKDIISKPVHVAEIGNTIYPGLFPQKTFYKNDFLESVADSNLKLPSVKSGVLELFESNPEIANAVYEAMGIKNNDNIDFENILESLGLSNLKTIKTPIIISEEDSPLKTEHGDAKGVRTKYYGGIVSSITLSKESTFEVLVHELLHEYFNSKYNTSKNEVFAKNIFNTLNRIAKENTWFERATKNYGKESYKDSSEELAILYLTSKEFRNNLPEAVKNKIEKWLIENNIITQQELNSYLDLNLDVKIKDYNINNSQITPQQKQQAQQLYSQYLEQNPNGNVEEFKSWVDEFNRKSKLQGTYDFSASSNSGKWNSANNELQSLVQNNRKAFAIYKFLIGEMETFKEIINYLNEKGIEIPYTDRMKRADETMTAEERKSAINSYNNSVDSKIEDKAQVEKNILSENNLQDETEYTPQELIEKYPLTGVQKVIWNLIKDIVNKLGIKVKFSSSRITEGFDGSNNPQNGEILIRPSTLKNGRFGEVLVHEIVHALTTKIISRVNLGVTTGLTQKQINAVKGLMKLFEAVKADNNLENKYPVKDVFEFIAHLTNEAFVKELESKDKNFLQKVVGFILDTLGITNANELSKKYLLDIISDGVFLQENGITVLPSDYGSNIQGSLSNFISQKSQENKSFDKELAQKIQDKLQKLYPEIKLNITNNPIWEQGDNVLNQEEYNNQVNYRLKATEKVLDNLSKIKQWESNKSIDQNTLWKKIGELGISKQQLDLLKESEGSTIEEKLSSFAANYSYTIEINTAKDEFIVSEYDSETDQFVDRNYGTKNTEHYSNLTVPGGTNYTENAIRILGIVNVVSAGGSYHDGDFNQSRGDMAGWFRSDEQVGEKEEIWEDIDDWTGKRKDFKELKLHGSKTRRILEVQSFFQKVREQNNLVGDEFKKKHGYFELDGYTYAEKYDNLTRQKTPYKFDSKYGKSIPVPQEEEVFISRDEYEQAKTRALGLDKEIQSNQFLQLLNKDNNWVTFFIKSIIQDSAKKGYEKVLFPKGETAAKIEGHETIANELAKLTAEQGLIQDQIDATIKNLQPHFVVFIEGKTKVTKTENEAKQIVNDYNNAIGEENPFSAKAWYETVEIEGKDLEIESLKDEIKELEKRKQELKSQGIEKLKPIEAFYEIKVGNILEKLFGKNNVKTITDEYGNQWREITINQARDLQDILLQRDEANRIIGQANIKAMTVLVDAVNQKQDTLPHEYAHHYIAWFRDTPIVQEAIKKWGSEEALVQSIGEQVVKQKGEAYSWWNNFVKWIMNQFNSLSKLQKEELTQILTDAFLTRQDLNNIGNNSFQQFQQSLNNPNTNPILQGSQEEQIKKFAELQERLNNKEFLEGAKNAYESTPSLQQFGTQEQYNDYIARVSLGIIKNPSSGEYNYNSRVKDIVYHGTDKDFTKFIKGKQVTPKGKTKGGIWFTDFANADWVYKEDNGKVIAALININNPVEYNTEREFHKMYGDYLPTKPVKDGQWVDIQTLLDNKKGDGLLLDIFDATTAGDIGEFTKQQVVFEPEQIHILGSKQDIEGFKEFVQKDNNSEINSSVSDDIDFNRESNKSNISEGISGNVNTQEGLNLTKSITVDETTNTVNINDILVNGTTTIKATSEFTIEGISDSNIETLIIEAPSVNVNTENFNVETLIIKTESQTSFPDINISQNSNIESLQIQNSNTSLEITDLTSENNLVFKNFVFADKNDCFLDNFTETSGFTINSAEPFKYSLNFDNSKNLTILQTNELKEIPVSIRNIENLTLEEDVEINIVSMQTTALNLNVNENNIIRLEKKYEKAAINIQAEEPTNITLHGKTRVNLDFKDKFVSINNNVSLTKDSDISFQEEAWSETEKFQEQQEKVLEKQYDSVEEYIDNDDPFDLKTSIDSYISEFNSINPELKKTAKIVQVEADSHAIYRENHTTTLAISESVADILEDRSPYIKVSEEEATNALMSSLNPASFLTVNEQLLATSVLDIDIDHLANKIISGLIYVNVNSVGMNVRTLFDNLTHLKEQFKDEKVVLENLKKLDSKLNEKYAELKVRIQKDSVTYSERVHKALEDTVLDENEETQQKRVLELSRKKLNAFYTEQINTLYKQLKEVTKQIELLLQEDTSAEFRVPAALKIKLQEKITDLKDQRLRVRNLRSEDIVSEFTVSLSNLTPLLDSYTEFIKFLEDNKEEINSVTLTHTIDKTIQDLVIALGQEQSKMETAKLLAFKDGKKVPETALDAYTSEMLKSLAGRVQLLSIRTSALARQSFFKYAAEVLNVDVADIAREIKALQDNGLPDTHILDEWFFDPTKGLFMPDKAGLFPSLMQMTLDSEINAWRSYAIRLITDLNNVQEEGDKALKKIRINGRKMNALDFKARNKYGRYTKHFIDVYNEDYIQNYKAVWRTLNELLKSKLDTPEKKNKSLKPFIDQIANQYEAVNIFKLSAFADLKGKRLPVYMDIDFQVDAEYEQSLKDKYGEEVFNYLVEQSKEKLLNKIQNWEYDFKSVAVANNVESFAELQAKNPEAANTLLEKLKDRLPLPSDFKDASYVAKTKLFVNSFTVPTSTKVFNKFFIDNILGNETIRKYYIALKNLENYIINQKNELDNVSYAAPLVKYKTFLEHFTDNRENHSFLMKTSAAFRSLFKDVNKLWFKTYKVPGEVTGIATQESLSIMPKAVPSNFYKNQMAIKKIVEAANNAVLTKKIPATSDSFVHFIFEKVANLPFVKGVTTVEDLMTEFNEVRANYVRISDAQNAVINSLLTHLEYEKSSTDLAETLKAHLLIINMATSRNMAQGKINILLKYFQDIKKTIKQKGTTAVSDRVRAKALSAVQTWYDKNIIGANLEADPDSAGKLRLGKEDRELLEYLRKEGILTEKESKEIQPFFTYKKLSAGAIVTAFLKYTIWKGLGWNMKGGSTNFMQGMFDDFIAGASGKYYTADYYYKALRMLPQSMFKFFTFSHKLVPKALRRNLENSDVVKFRRLMDKFKVLQDSSNLLQQAGKNEKFLNTQKLDAFHWQKSIEYLNQGVLILGEIYSRDIQINENTKVKLWDLFDQQGNLKEEYASNKELYINWQLGRGKQFNAFTSKVNKMIVEVHGDYQETRGFKASHSEVGRALILFKKFFPQQVANRWSKKQTVYELGEDTMGRTEDSLDKMQTIGRYRALTPSAAALVGAANIRTSLSAALLRPIFGNRLKPLLSIADAVISPWLLPATAIGAVVGATWAIAAKLYNGKQKGAKIFGDMPQVLGRTLYGFITTPVNVLAGRELLKNTYSNKSLSALENLAMNESLNDVRITLFMTMLGMLIRWKLHRDPNDDGSDDEESTTDQVLLAILNRIDVNLAEHTQYTDPLSMLQFLDLTKSSPANTLAQMINMPIKVQKQMERIEKMTEIEKYFLTDSDYDRASYWVGFKETFLPSPARKYWGWSSSMNFDFTTEIKTRETKQFVPALYHPIEWLTTTKEQREEKEIEARILNIKNAYKKEFKNLYFDYFQSLDESEKNEFADELKEVIDKAMVKPKYLDNEQTLSFFENESMLRAKVNLSIKKFYFTDRFKQQQVKIKNNKEAQAAYNAVIKLFEKQKNDDLYKINGGAILNYSTKYKIYKKEIINRERELKEALNRAGINYIAPKAVEKVAI